MTCLAALGARNAGFTESARGAGRNIVRDGYPIGCGKRIFEDLGIPFERYTMTGHNNVASRLKESVCNGT